MEILQKKPREILFADIQSLVDSKIKENNYLEYKGSDYLNKSKNPSNFDKHKGDLAEKIAGFANNRGGLIIIGIKEDTTTKEPIKIQSPEITNFEQLLASIIWGSLQPAIIVDWAHVLSDNNPSDFVYIIKVPESATPVMLYRSGYKEGVFPFRVGEDTKSAELIEVEMLFQKKQSNLQRNKAALNIFETLFRVFYYPQDQLSYNAKFSMLHRIAIQFKAFLPELGIINHEGSKSVFYILDRYMISGITILDMHTDVYHDEEQGNIKETLMDLLSQLKEYWQKTLLIWLKVDDFSDPNLRNMITFE